MRDEHFGACRHLVLTRPVGRSIVCSVSDETAVTLTREEWRLVHEAVTSMLDDFGHDEAEILRALKALLAKLPEP